MTLNEDRRASYSVCCATCGAGQGEPCIIPAHPKPRRCHYTHTPRKRAVAALLAARRVGA